jgi:hypothetical protein
MIGSGLVRGTQSFVRNITILDGNFTFTGGISECAVGIGAARASGYGVSSVELIHIRGGCFQTDTYYGPAFGAGCAGMIIAPGGISTVSTLLIEGGTFPNLRADVSSVIGTAFAENGGSSIVDNLTITGGNFSSITGGDGAAIGAGATVGDGTLAHVGLIDIRGGSFRIVVDAGAAIGAGTIIAGGNATVDHITIEGGDFVIRTNGFASGIGGGFVMGFGETESITTSVGVLEIFGGSIDITLTGRGAGIGAGAVNNFADSSPEQDFDANVGVLTIYNGSFRVLTTWGAAIGAGSGANWSASVENLTIFGGEFTLSTGLGSGIGSGDSSSGFVNHLVIEGGTITVNVAPTAIGSANTIVLSRKVTIDCRRRLSNCVAGDDILIDGSVAGITNTKTFFTGANIKGTAQADLDIPYRSKSAPEPISIPALHFARILGQQPNETYKISFSNDEYAKIVEYGPDGTQGLLVSLRDIGFYEVELKSTAGQNLSLCNGTEPRFEVGSGDTFVSVAQTCDYIWPTSTASYFPLPTSTIIQSPRASPDQTFAPTLSGTEFTLPTSSEEPTESSLPISTESPTDTEARESPSNTQVATISESPTNTHFVTISESSTAAQIPTISESPTNTQAATISESPTAAQFPTISLSRSPTADKSNQGLVIGLSVGGGALVIVIAVVAIVIYRKHSGKKLPGTLISTLADDQFPPGEVGQY